MERFRLVLTKAKAERDLVCRWVDLRGVRICMWLYKCITILLMFVDELSKAHKNIVIKSLGLAASQWIIPYCCQVSNNDGTHCREECSDELSKISMEDVCLDAVLE